MSAKWLRPLHRHPDSWSWISSSRSISQTLQGLFICVSCWGAFGPSEPAHRSSISVDQEGFREEKSSNIANLLLNPERMQTNHPVSSRQPTNQCNNIHQSHPTIRCFNYGIITDSVVLCVCSFFKKRNYKIALLDNVSPLRVIFLKLCNLFLCSWRTLKR